MAWTIESWVSAVSSKHAAALIHLLMCLSLLIYKREASHRLLHIDVLHCLSRLSTRVRCILLLRWQLFDIDPSHWQDCECLVGLVLLRLLRRTTIHSVQRIRSVSFVLNWLFHTGLNHYLSTSSDDPLVVLLSCLSKEAR